MKSKKAIPDEDVEEMLSGKAVLNTDNNHEVQEEDLEEMLSGELNLKNVNNYKE